MLTLYPEQEAAVAKMTAASGRSALVTAQVGWGKTVVTVETAKRLGARTILIIGPLNIDKAWEGAFEGQNYVLPFFRINSTKKGLQAFADLKAGKEGIYYIGREFFALSGTDSKDKKRKARWSWSTVKPDLAVYDEVHGASNRKSVSAQALWPLKAGYKVALSATPAGNKFQGIWSVCRWLWPNEIPRGFWAWAKQWANVVPDPYTHWRVEDEKNPGEFVKSLPCYIYGETKVQEPLVKRIECDLLPSQRKQYADLKKQALTWIEDNPLVADLPITLRIRLRQASLAEMSLTDDEEVYFDLDADSAKIEVLKRIVADNPLENLLILTDSQRFAEVVAHRLGPRAVEWSGKTSQEDRQRILRTFGSQDGPQYIVGVIPALAEGVDGLQHHARIVVWLNKSSNGILNVQAMGRLNRTGQKHRVTSVEIVARNTLDTADIDVLNMNAAQMKATLTKED